MGCGSSQAKASSSARGWVLQQFDEHKGPINCSALSEDESLLITGSEDATVKMWSTQSDPVELLGKHSIASSFFSGVYFASMSRSVFCGCGFIKF